MWIDYGFIFDGESEKHLDVTGVSLVNLVTLERKEINYSDFRQAVIAGEIVSQTMSRKDLVASPHLILKLSTNKLLNQYFRPVNKKLDFYSTIIVNGVRKIKGYNCMLFIGNTIPITLEYNCEIDTFKFSFRGLDISTLGNTSVVDNLLLRLRENDTNIMLSNYITYKGNNYIEYFNGLCEIICGEEYNIVLPTNCRCFYFRPDFTVKKVYTLVVPKGIKKIIDIKEYTIVYLSKEMDASVLLEYANRAVMEIKDIDNLTSITEVLNNYFSKYYYNIELRLY
jgi:hypothetical protein